MRILALDIGGIVFEPRWRLYGLEEVSSKIGTSKEKLKTALSKHKNNFYVGKISEDEYWNNIRGELEIQMSVDLSSLYRHYVTLNEEIIPILELLKNKFTLVACNNCSKEWMDYRIKLANLDKFFKKYITSGYVGYMKPDPQFYRLIVEAYPKEDILYMDDDSSYIVAAESIGLKSKLYKDKTDLITLLS